MSKREKRPGMKATSYEVPKVSALDDVFLVSKSEEYGEPRIEIDAGGFAMTAFHPEDWPGIRDAVDALVADFK